ncbi:MAG: pyruvate kinase, partial [Pseudomonadales bacterium]
MPKSKQRRTKIVATLGPATDPTDTLEQLILAGVNVVRLNFSHGTTEDHKQRAATVMQLSEKLNAPVAILGDLQGPKIRIQSFANGPIQLEPGQTFVLDASLDASAGTVNSVGIDFKTLAADCSSGDLLLLDDGRIRLRVDKVDDPRVQCTVEMGGILSNKKGINKLGGGLAAPALTDKDFADMRTAAEIDVDYLAVSFPSTPEDIELARSTMRELGCQARIVAKIERAEAVADKELLDRIIKASHVIMVARGDLGVEIGDAELIGVQKHLIKRSRQLNRCVITATQMMESMIDNPVPTRAEVFDIANAVLDGSDAVML